MTVVNRACADSNSSQRYFIDPKQKLNVVVTHISGQGSHGRAKGGQWMILRPLWREMRSAEENWGTSNLKHTVFLWVCV